MSLVSRPPNKEVVAATQALIALVRAGGSPLSDPSSLKILSEFRESHITPAVILRIRLATLATTIDPNSLATMRPKRVPTILEKLAFRTPRLSILEMQDIGGCRVIVDSVDAVYRLIAGIPLGRVGNQQYVPVPKLSKDYIAKPQDSGYRSVHLVHAYDDNGPASALNGLRVETQVRTRVQHAWATAQEAVEDRTGEKLKSADRTQPHTPWQRFFALVSGAFAHLEGTPRVPHTPGRHVDLLRELATLRQALEVDALLEGYKAQLTIQTPIFRIATAPQVAGYLLQLDSVVNRLSISTIAETAAVSSAYVASERQAMAEPATNTVFVSLSGVERLREAYPNYYADTSEFLRILDEVLA